MFFIVSLVLICVVALVCLIRSDSAESGHGAVSNVPPEAFEMKSAFAICGPVAHIGPDWMNDE